MKLLAKVVRSNNGTPQFEVKYKDHPYRVKLALESVRSLQFEELIKFYTELAEADYYMKTGFGDKETYFYVLLTKLAQLK